MRVNLNVIVLLTAIYTSSAMENLEFEYVKTLEIKSAISHNDNLFILFFDRRDGTTEDIHREFLKAKEMLKAERLKIKVLEYNGILSQRYETMFDVYKYPKIKFFKKGKAAETYDGLIKSPVIKAWTKTKLRKPTLTSIEAKNPQQLASYLANKEKSIIVYWGHADGNLFDSFETMAKSQKTTFIWSYDSDNRLLLEYITTKLFIHREMFTQIENKNEKSVQTILNFSQNFNNDTPAIYFINKYQFSKNFIFSSNKALSTNTIVLNKFIDQIIKTNLITDFDEYTEYLKTNKGPGKYAFMLINTDSLYKVARIWSQLPKTGLFNKYIILDMQNSANRNGITAYLKYPHESFIILEVDPKSKPAKYKLDVNYSHKSAESNVRKFLTDYKNKKLKVFLKSKKIIEPMKNGIREINAAGFGAFIHNNMKRQCMVIFYGNESPSYAALLKYIRDNVSLLSYMDIYLFDVYNNEFDEDLTKKSLPYIRVYDKTKKKFESVAFSNNRSVMEAFIAKYFVESDL